MNPYRTHNCAALRAENAGMAAKLAGWVDTIRDHGGVTFIDLRDQFGITQVVVDDQAKLTDVRRETVISVGGTVRNRGEG
ncbi:MAG: OB-fold nucleic acid binding domain-containing protein, partial [Oscillospiraceae bacterium]|nr:OB-fold nucleic acid binding domain-containing protein [Oscillospiraceae bacterium]